MKIQLTHDELLELLDEQLEFLKASACSFDNGFKGEIKRLAQSVRVLVHDTHSSTSLLSLIQKKSMQFLDTSVPYEEENLFSHSGLVLIRMGGNISGPEPFLDGGLFSRKIEFENWWNGVVFVDNDRNEFSRKDIVLTLANKEGGAHVDHELDSRYANLRKNNSLGWLRGTNDGKETPGEDQVPAAMRQIAHEIIKTLDPNYQVDDVYTKRGGLISFGASLVASSFPPPIPSNNLVKNRPLINGQKIGRNDPCTCKSGKKYKMCCLTR